jgi:hypothetical protein
VTKLNYTKEYKKCVSIKLQTSRTSYPNPELEKFISNGKVMSTRMYLEDAV